MQKILVTGAAGFVGFHYARALCQAGYDVLGTDNLNDYYDVRLKEARLEQLAPLENFRFEKADLADRAAMARLFKSFRPDVVAHMGAQAGVRYSIENPHIYIDSNLTGFTNILEGCRHEGVKHLIFASSSSVYGANTKLPFCESHNVDHPVSLYAATKKANELLAHSYAHLYRLPVTGLRFFTVYGPWGRPDMAYFKFTKSILKGEEIPVFNHGDMKRDFTYIDDIIESMIRLVTKIPQEDAGWRGDDPNPSTSNAPYRIYNIGNNSPEQLTDLIACIEAELGVKARIKMLPMQAGDVYATYADTDDLARDIGFKPSTKLKEGIHRFVSWYKGYYQADNSAAA